jgi:hypothetical protein
VEAALVVAVHAACKRACRPVMTLLGYTMSNNHVLTWNACGLNCRARRSVVRDSIVQQRASVVCLQESKVADSVGYRSLARLFVAVA